MHPCARRGYNGVILRYSVVRESTTIDTGSGTVTEIQAIHLGWFGWFGSRFSFRARSISDLPPRLAEIHLSGLDLAKFYSVPIQLSRTWDFSGVTAIMFAFLERIKIAFKVPQLCQAEKT
jgi:hypothetical protein